MSDSRAAQAGGRGLTSWLFAPVPVHVMVVNRFVLGGVLFLQALSRLPEFEVLYGRASGTWSAPYRAWVATFLAPDLASPMLVIVDALARLDETWREPLLAALYGLWLIAAAAFTTGLWTRRAGCLAVALHLLFLTIHPYAHYGWASLLASFSLCVILSRAGDHASVDAWRRRRRGIPPPSPSVSVWPMRLLQLQVAVMYFHTGFARVDDPLWLRGDALFEALTRTLFTRVSLEIWNWTPALRLLTWSVFVLEPAAAVLLWIPRIRTWIALALIAMHVVLEILTNVGWWNYMMLGGLLAFLPAPWLARALPLRVGPETQRPAPGLRPGR